MDRRRTWARSAAAGEGPAGLLPPRPAVGPGTVWPSRSLQKLTCPVRDPPPASAVPRLLPSSATATARPERNPTSDQGLRAPTPGALAHLLNSAPRLRDAPLPRRPASRARQGAGWRAFSELADELTRARPGTQHTSTRTWMHAHTKHTQDAHTRTTSATLTESARRLAFPGSNARLPVFRALGSDQGAERSVGRPQTAGFSGQARQGQGGRVTVAD